MTAVNLHVDQIDTITVGEVDSKNDPIVPPIFDSPPVWTNSNLAAATLATSPDGSSSVLTPVAGAVGQSTTVGVTVVSGGVTFQASNVYTIISGAVAGITLTDVFSTPPQAPAQAPA